MTAATMEFEDEVINRLVGNGAEVHAVRAWTVHQVVAMTVAVLLEDGLVQQSPTWLARACRSLGISPTQVQKAYRARQNQPPEWTRNPRLGLEVNANIRPVPAEDVADDVDDLIGVPDPAEPAAPAPAPAPDLIGVPEPAEPAASTDTLGRRRETKPSTDGEALGYVGRQTGELSRKVCNGCGEGQAISRFRRQSKGMNKAKTARRYGRDHLCKQCRADNNQTRYMSVEKQNLLGAVNLEFTAEGNLVCATCMLPIDRHDTAIVVGRSYHDECTPPTVGDPDAF